MTASTDPVADMLTRIRNAAAVQKQTVSLSHSKIKEAVARLLVEKNFIDKVEVHQAETSPGNVMILTLNGEHANSRITEVVRLSRPGRRTYAGAKDIPVVKRGRGVVIVSTSKGVMTGDQARQQGVGGELICRVY